MPIKPVTPDRFCQFTPCGGLISRLKKSDGYPLTDAVYAARVFCSPSCMSAYHLSRDKEAEAESRESEAEILNRSFNKFNFPVVKR